MPLVVFLSVYSFLLLFSNFLSWLNLFLVLFLADSGKEQKYIFVFVYVCIY